MSNTKSVSKDTTTVKNNQAKDFTIETIPIPGWVPPPYYGGYHTDCGEFETEVTMSGRCLTHVKRIDATHYIDLKTGEVREYRKPEPGEDYRKRLADMWRAFEGLKAVLRFNFPSDKANALFITKTYRENMRDRRRLMLDEDKFMRALRKEFPDIDFEYITVAEPQERGAWHTHTCLKADNLESLYIPHEKIQSLWPHGFTDTRRLKSDDVGRYYTAYFTGVISQDGIYNQDFDESSEDTYRRDKAIADCAGDVLLPKQYRKGARLKFYPRGMRLFRCSKGIRRPGRVWAVRGEPSPDRVLEYSRAIAVVRQYRRDSGKFKKGETEVINNIYKATYRKVSSGDPLSAARPSAPGAQPESWDENDVIKAKIAIESMACIERLSLDENLLDGFRREKIMNGENTNVLIAKRDFMRLCALLPDVLSAIEAYYSGDDGRLESAMGFLDADKIAALQESLELKLRSMVNRENFKSGRRY